MFKQRALCGLAEIGTSLGSRGTRGSPRHSLIRLEDKSDVSKGAASPWRWKNFRWIFGGFSQVFWHQKSTITIRSLGFFSWFVLELLSMFPSFTGIFHAFSHVERICFHRCPIINAPSTNLHDSRVARSARSALRALWRPKLWSTKRMTRMQRCMLILVGNTRPQFAMENPGAAGNSRTRGLQLGKTSIKWWIFQQAIFDNGMITKGTRGLILVGLHNRFSGDFPWLW